MVRTSRPRKDRDFPAATHTWHYFDYQLFRIIQDGLAAIAPGYETDMPAFDGMTMVRMDVAKSELTPSMPNLANIAVIAANTGDRSAHSCHNPSMFMPSFQF